MKNIDEVRNITVAKTKGSTSPENIVLQMKNDAKHIVAVTDSHKARIVLMVLSLISIVVAILILPHVRFSRFAFAALVSFVFATLGLFVGNGVDHERISVTDNFVFMKNLCGKEMYLPIDSVTAVGTSFFGTVYVTTHSCKMRCMFVSNTDEVVRVVTELIEKRAVKALV